MDRAVEEARKNAKKVLDQYPPIWTGQPQSLLYCKNYYNVKKYFEKNWSGNPVQTAEF
jgi:hypothetical protein